GNPFEQKGFPPDPLPKIFDKFFLYGGTATEKKKSLKVFGKRVYGVRFGGAASVPRFGRTPTTSLP
ncbi:MAG: hypothetical protein J1F60_09085, partial [Oscillospiraceae bacterium]|nr:hypothetical protein [Oscillospiraceae bacterium]